MKMEDITRAEGRRKTVLTMTVATKKDHSAIFKVPTEGCPGGPGIKNLPCSAKVTGVIPGLRRFHTPRGY